MRQGKEGLPPDEPSSLRCGAKWCKESFMVLQTQTQVQISALPTTHSGTLSKAGDLPPLSLSLTICRMGSLATLVWQGHREDWAGRQVWSSGHTADTQEQGPHPSCDGDSTAPGGWHRGLCGDPAGTAQWRVCAVVMHSLAPTLPLAGCVHSRRCGSCLLSWQHRPIGVLGPSVPEACHCGGVGVCGVRVWPACLCVGVGV